MKRKNSQRTQKNSSTGKKWQPGGLREMLGSYLEQLGMSSTAIKRTGSMDRVAKSLLITNTTPQPTSNTTTKDSYNSKRGSRAKSNSEIKSDTTSKQETKTQSTPSDQTLDSGDGLSDGGGVGVSDGDGGQVLD